MIVVHRVLARQRRRADDARDPWLAVALAAVAIAVAWWRFAAIPMVAVAAVTCAIMPRASYLRTIGLAFVAASVATGVLVYANL